MKKELDLHGVKHSEVRRKIDSFIGEHLMGGTKSVYIITGHSKEMKSIVSEILADYQIIPEEDFLNVGNLIVSLQ